MKPRIRHQRRGWVIEQGVLLIGIKTTFRGACAFADRWVRQDWELI
jgi:hypothetical protein